MYVSSEGRAGCIANNLTDLIQLLAAYPYWQDLLHFSGCGKLAEMKRVPEYSEDSLQDDYPDINDRRTELLGLFDLSPAENAIDKLYQAVSSSGEKFEVRAPDGYKYEGLFNKFVVDDNPMWCR